MKKLIKTHGDKVLWDKQERAETVEIRNDNVNSQVGEFQKVQAPGYKGKREIVKGVIMTNTGPGGKCNWGTGYRVPFIVYWSEEQQNWFPDHLQNWEPI